jgi:site-specific DNA recombinase
MKAAVLARVSSNEQAKKGTSLADQIKSCTARAKEEGYEVAPSNVYREEGVSGATPLEERPVLQTALEALNNGVDVLYVLCPDRLSREPDEYYNIEREVERAGGTIRYVTISVDDSPEGGLLLDMVKAIGKYERKQFRRRSGKGHRERLESGTSLGVGRPPPWLKVTEDKDGNKAIVLDEDKAKEMRRLFKDYAAGVSSLDLALRHGVEIGTLYDWIENPVAAGHRYMWPFDKPNPHKPKTPEHKAWKLERARIKRDVMREAIRLSPEEADAKAIDAGLIVQAVPALIPWQKWQKLARLKNSRYKAHSPQRSLRLPLQRRITCGACGGTYIAEVAHGGAGRTYLVCLRRKERKSIALGRPQCTTSPRLRYDDVEEAVAQTVAKLLSDPKAVRRAGKEYLADLEQRIEELEDSVGPVEEKLGKLKARRERATKAYVAGDLSEANWTEEKARTDKEIARLQEQLDANIDAHEELLFVRERAAQIKATLASDFAASPDGALVGKLLERAGKRVHESRKTLAAALDNLKAKITIAPDGGMTLEAAILPEPVSVGGTDGNASCRSRSRPRYGG